MSTGGPDALAAENSRAAALEAVHARIRACTACPLHVTRTNAVPGDGPVTARIMAVGEAPGENEDRQGKPFVGAAGQLLTKLLESIGLQRSDMYITNVIKSRPPKNRDPEQLEVEACAHFLDEQIDVIKPDVILILGRHALGRLLPGSRGISHLHGTRVQRGNRLYVPLYHPAAALYNGSLLSTLNEDMQKVRTYLDEAEEVRRAAMAAATSNAESNESASREQLSLF